MNLSIKFLSISLVFTLGLSSLAQEKAKRFNFELGGTFNHFEQQIKTKIGGAKGELLAADTEFGIQMVGTYKIWKFIHAGWYAQYDIGNRESAQFNGFDSTGATLVVNVLGGGFNEFWTGPLVRAQYKKAFLEFGYGLVGIRNDKARTDLLNTNGSNVGSLSIDPSVAWLFGIGAQVNMFDNLSLLVKAQYRVRYYNKRDGLALQNETVHGTQNFSPLIGLNYKF